MAQPRYKALFKFHMNNYMHICYGLFLSTTTVQELKQYVMEDWPQDEYLIPEKVKEIILTFDGKLLKDERTLYGSGLLSDDIIPCGAITINVTGQPLPPSIAVTVQPPPPSNVRSIMARPRDKALFQFLMNDCKHICYGLLLPTTTVQELKQYLVKRDEYLIPENVKEIILTFDGKLLKDERTLYGSGLLSDDIIPYGAITIHVTRQPLPPSIAVTVQPPPPSNVRYESLERSVARTHGCPCTIL